MSQRAEVLPCDRVLDLIEPLIDGELETGPTLSVKAHLDSCSSCAAEFRLAEEIRAELRVMPNYDPPDRLLTAVAEAAETTLSERIRRVLVSRILRPVPAAVAAAAAVAVLVIQPWSAPTEVGFSESDVARATAETKLALAYVGGVSRRAQSEVQARVIEGESMTMTVRRISQSMKWTGNPGSEEAEINKLPREVSKGSS